MVYFWCSFFTADWNELKPGVVEGEGNMFKNLSRNANYVSVMVNRWHFYFLRPGQIVMISKLSAVLLPGITAITWWKPGAYLNHNAPCDNRDLSSTSSCSLRPLPSRCAKLTCFSNNSQIHWFSLRSHWRHKHLYTAFFTCLLTISCKQILTFKISVWVSLDVWKL